MSTATAVDEIQGEIDESTDATPMSDIGGVESGFFVRKPSWGRGGTTLEKAPTAAEALKQAGLDWSVSKEPTYRKVYTGEGNKFNFRQVKDRFVVVRDVDQAELGSVGKDYKVYQNSDALDFLDGLAFNGEIEYETAGSLFGGKKVWFMCKTPNYIEIAGGDKIQPYMFVSTTHDGSGAITAAFTGTRIECANTFTTAHRGATNKYTFRHTASSEGKLQEARESLKLQLTWDDAFKKEMDALVTTQVTDEQFKQILEANYPAQKVQGPKSIATILENRRTSTTIQDEYRNTAYGALNAVTEFTEHIRDYRTDEARMKAVMLGWAANLNTVITRELVGLAS